MNRRTLLLSGLLAVASIQAAEPPPPEIIAFGAVVTDRTVTIALAAPFNGIPIVPFPAVPPISVATNTRLKFVPSVPGVIASVQWFKDNNLLPQTGTTLEILAATPADSGRYSALVKRVGAADFSTDQAIVVVSARQGQRLLNTSARGRLGPEQPALIHGFVIEPGLNGTGNLFLIRAVGPALGAFGVSNPLAAPQLHVLDSRGQEMPISIIPFVFPSVAEATQRTGAFPLPAGGKDVANLYFLPAGAFTAHVSSADGTAGTALVEVYEVPY